MFECFFGTGVGPKTSVSPCSSHRARGSRHDVLTALVLWNQQYSYQMVNKLNSCQSTKCLFFWVLHAVESGVTPFACQSCWHLSFCRNTKRRGTEASQELPETQFTACILSSPLLSLNAGPAVWSVRHRGRSDHSKAVVAGARRRAGEDSRAHRRVATCERSTSWSLSSWNFNWPAIWQSSEVLGSSLFLILSRAERKRDLLGAGRQSKRRIGRMDTGAANDWRRWCVRVLCRHSS